jgi:hypothetical protein
LHRFAVIGEAIVEEMRTWLSVRFFDLGSGGSDLADKIRLGLIGASVKGTWSARSHLPAVQASADIELTAVCTTKADSAEAARQAYLQNDEPH